MKSLVLKSDSNDFELYYIDKINQRGDVDAHSYYKKTKGLIRCFSVLYMGKLDLPFQHFLYGDWKKKILNYDTIIVFDSVWSKRLLNFLHKKNPTAKIIFWYWNKIDNQLIKLIDEKYREYCEVWSFDNEDCKNYNFLYSNQFYFWQKRSDDSILYDMVFFGVDKGRGQRIKSMFDIFKEKNYKTLVRILKDKTSKVVSEYHVKQKTSYMEIIDSIQKCRCIVDIPREGQKGLTARVLESLFYEKKLITIDKDIVKYDFYHRNNIFIWGKDDLKELEFFMDCKYEPVKEEIRAKYDFDYWLKDITHNLSERK